MCSTFQPSGGFYVLTNAGRNIGAIWPCSGGRWQAQYYNGDISSDWQYSPVLDTPDAVLGWLDGGEG